MEYFKTFSKQNIYVCMFCSDNITIITSDVFFTCVEDIQNSLYQHCVK